MYFEDQVKADIQERFTEMVHPVKLVVFSQALQHPESEEVKRLIEELATLDPRLIVELQETKNGRQRHGWAEISAHAVDRDGNVHRRAIGSGESR